MDPDLKDRSINIVPIVVVLPVLVWLVAIAVGVGAVGAVGAVVTGVVDDAEMCGHGQLASLGAGH